MRGAIENNSTLDPLLVAALSLAFLLCLQGITWGRVEDWNRSQIAMRGLCALRPSDYMKPPFHTYLNHVLVVWPITGVMKIAQVPTERMKIANSARLIGSRLVTVALFLGTIALAYSFIHRSYGRFSAAIIAFAFATSAGFVPYAHFLTAAALGKRNPNYITIHSLDYNVPGETVRRYYGELLTGNSLTPLCSMARRHARLHGFIRISSISCADASLFCSGKIGDRVRRLPSASTKRA